MTNLFRCGWALLGCVLAGCSGAPAPPAPQPVPQAPAPQPQPTTTSPPVAASTETPTPVVKDEAVGPELTVLAKGESPGEIALGGDWVYWTDEKAGSVSRVPKKGGKAEVIASRQSMPQAIVADTGAVYWGTMLKPRSIKARSHSGGDIRTVVADVPSGWGVSLAVADDRLFWAPNAVDAEISMVPAGGGGGKVLAKGQFMPKLAVHDGALYWLSTGTKTRGPGAVMKVSLDGGSPKVLAPNQPEPDAIAVDDSGVYWTRREEPAALMMVGVDGGKPSVVAGDLKNPMKIALDGDAVYWTEIGESIQDDAGGGRVTKKPKGEGSPVALATDLGKPTGIAVDETHVYWADRGRGTVMRIGK